MELTQFQKLPIMGILRGVSLSVIPALTRTIISSGLKTVEIAMNTAGASKLIKEMKVVARGRLAIGAGTVLTMRDLKKALDAGATFIVLPVLVPNVVEYCVKHNIPVFPGAFTPHEIYNAWQAGATMVKVFPVKFFSPAYLKEIKAPFKNIELLACGGVNPQNIQTFFSDGASAVAFGASVFKKEWIKRKEFFRISEVIKTLIAAYKNQKR